MFFTADGNDGFTKYRCLGENLRCLWYWSGSTWQREPNVPSQSEAG